MDKTDNKITIIIIETIEIIIIIIIIRTQIKEDNQVEINNVSRNNEKNHF